MKGRAGRPRVNDCYFFGSYAFGLVCDQVFYSALSWSALELTQSDLYTGLICSVGSLPRLLFMVPAGFYSDRWGYKKVVLVSCAVKFVVLSAAALCFAVAPLSVVALVALALALGLFEAFYLPACQGLMVSLSGAGLVGRQSLLTLLQKLAAVAAPYLAGVLVAGDNAVLFGFIALMALVSVVLCIPVDAEGLAGNRKDATKGQMGFFDKAVTILSANRRLRRSFFFILATEFAASGIINTGATLLCAYRSMGSEDMGRLLAVYGLGAGIAALAKLAAPKGAGSPLPATAVFGLAAICAGLFSSSVLIYVAFFVMGLGSGFASIALSVSFLQAAPRDELGVSSALLNVAAFGCTALSSLVGGAVSELASAPASFLLYGAILLCCAASNSFW